MNKYHDENEKKAPLRFIAHSDNLYGTMIMEYKTK